MTREWEEDSSCAFTEMKKSIDSNIESPQNLAIGTVIRQPVV